MSQHYSNPARENDPHALPDVEVFYLSIRDMMPGGKYPTDDTMTEPGWYWWSCFPGCLPDSDPVGPFATEADALADAQEGSES